MDETTSANGAKWGVYAPQATANYERASSLAQLHARIGPLHLVKERQPKMRSRPRLRITLLDAVIFCLLAFGAFHLAKAGEVAFWTGYEAQATKGYK
jgi:hypothetical protein